MRDCWAHLQQTYGSQIMTISTILLATRHYIIPTLFHSFFLRFLFPLKNHTTALYPLFSCFSFTLHFLGVIVYVMEPSLGLLGGGGGGGGGRGGGGGGGMGLSCEQTAKVEKDYMGMPKEAELELGLGLSLGNSGGGGGGVVVKGKGSAWGEYGRILTAKDFPNGFSSGRTAAGAGTKRERAAADCVDEGSASAAVSQVVGWPPIRAYRMNTLFNQAKTSNVEEDKGVGGNENNENSKKKINHGSDKTDAAIKERGHLGFVKVNMDGLPIGRKVDLNAHKSYETLANTLEEMFFNPSITIRGGKEQSIQPPKLLDGSSEFVLTYEDKEGDWMLVGDVPWGMFLNTVKRLRIMRTSEANGLGVSKVPRKG